MAYYPKSQIKTNLYTNGDELTLTQNQTLIQPENYIGYYFVTSTGQLFTGKDPSDTPNNPLYIIQPSPFSENPSEPTISPNIIIYDYNSLNLTYTIQNNINPSQTRIIPQFNLTLPTPEDKKRGYFVRYFCKKNNELIYYETSQADHDRIKNQDPSTAYDLYSVAALKWYIDGNPPQVSSQNISQVNQISSANLWLGFIQYFKGDFTKYLGT